jgi:BirA family transcriptional regulator, biotin operon repressor / biotin---[acetyl-CoA-carboxylase] ligase
MPGLLTAYLRGLRAGVVRLSAPGGREALLSAYGERCMTVGRDVRVEVSDRPPVEGRAVGIGYHGELVVETVDRMLAVRFGEVVHLR